MTVETIDKFIWENNLIVPKKVVATEEKIDQAVENNDNEHSANT